MPTPDRRRPHLVERVLAILVVPLAIAGIVLQYAVSGSLGHTLIGGSVVGAMIVTVRRRGRDRASRPERNKSA